MTAQVSVGDNAEVLTNMLQRNPVIGGWRLTLRVRVKDPKLPVEMRAALVQNGKTLSETWSYQLSPYSVATP